MAWGAGRESAAPATQTAGGSASSELARRRQHGASPGGGWPPTGPLLAVQSDSEPRHEPVPAILRILLRAVPAGRPAFAGPRAGALVRRGWAAAAPPLLSPSEGQEVAACDLNFKIGACAKSCTRMRDAGNLPDVQLRALPAAALLGGGRGEGGRTSRQAAGVHERDAKNALVSRPERAPVFRGLAFESCLHGFENLLFLSHEEKLGCDRGINNGGWQCRGMLIMAATLTYCFSYDG